TMRLRRFSVPVLGVALLLFGAAPPAQAAKRISEYRVPTPSTPQEIAAGPDGSMWFTEYDGNEIGRITTRGAITEYPIPTAYNYNRIGRTTMEGVTTEYAIPTPRSYPEGITAGPDGALWFTEALVNKIGRITTDGVITEYPIPTPSTYPRGIAAGPDGNLWFA